MQLTPIIIIAAIALILFLSKTSVEKIIPLQTDNIRARLSQFDSIIENAAARFHIPVNLIRAIIWQESSGNPNAYRDEGKIRIRGGRAEIVYSYGLMGITSEAAEDVGFRGDSKNLFDPETNIMYGTAYLRWLQKVNIPRLYGKVENAWVDVNRVRMPLDLMLAIIAYNTGSGNIKRDRSTATGWRWTEAGNKYLDSVTKKWAALEGIQVSRQRGGAGREF